MRARSAASRAKIFIRANIVHLQKNRAMPV
jgi:hypothetical protein